MTIDIFNRILTLLYVMSLLNVIRHAYYFIQAWVKSDSENPQKYKLNNKSLLLLSISISYLITTIFNGIKL